MVCDSPAIIVLHTVTAVADNAIDLIATISVNQPIAEGTLDTPGLRNDPDPTSTVHRHRHPQVPSPGSAVRTIGKPWAPSAHARNPSAVVSTCGSRLINPALDDYPFNAGWQQHRRRAATMSMPSAERRFAPPQKPGQWGPGSLQARDQRPLRQRLRHTTTMVSSFSPSNVVQ